MSATHRRIAVTVVSGVLLALSAGGPALAETSFVDVEVPYLGTIPVELPEGWVAAECPQGALPDLIDVRCDGASVTFTGLGFGPEPQDVVLAATTPSGAVRLVVYEVTLAPPSLTGPSSHSYGYPLGKGSRITIPFADLRYDCGACTTTGPTYTGLEVSPTDAGIARFTGFGVEFAPAPEFVGEVHLSFRVRDTLGQETEPATLSLLLLPGRSRAPITVPDLVDGEAGLPVEGNVQSNDVPVSQDTAVVVACGRPSNGVVECRPDGSFTYTPDPDFTGIDQFAYHTTTERTGDQAVGSVAVGSGADAAVILRQEAGAELAPLFAPGRRDAGAAILGELAFLRDAASAIPRVPAG